MIRVPVQRAVLEWACGRRGGGPESYVDRFPALPRWLDGSLSPTLKQLEAFAAATTAPIGLLFLPEPPNEDLPIPDLRTVRSTRPSRASAELLDTVYLCQQRQGWYREYARSVGEPLKSFVGSIGVDADPMSAAATIRTALGMEVAAPGSPDHAFRWLAQQAEALGVLVMANGIVGVNTHRRLDPDEFRGFALADPWAPLVFVNTADAAAARMFTLAHELAHLWCGATAVSDQTPASGGAPGLERWCNAVAAEVLVPLDALRSRIGDLQDPLTEARRLARIFKVSTLVVLRRMRDFGAIDPETMDELYAQEIAFFRARQQRREGGGDFYRTQRARLGGRFVGAVLESTWEGHTSFTEAFGLLGARNVATLQRLGAAADAA